VLGLLLLWPLLLLLVLCLRHSLLPTEAAVAAAC
jgi:hypothetical protein